MNTLTNDEAIVKNLLENYYYNYTPNCDFYYVSKKHLKDTLKSFKEFMNIPNGNAFCQCGTTSVLAKIIGKDYRDSDLLFSIIEENYKTRDLPTAIINIIGVDAYNIIFDEKTIFSKEYIAVTFETYKDLYNLTDETIEQFKNNELITSNIIQLIKFYLEMFDLLPSNDELFYPYPHIQGAIPTIVVRNCLKNKEKKEKNNV